MPYRKTPLVNDHFYHILNRGLGRQSIFKTKNDYQRALEVINFYRFDKPSLKFSSFLRLSDKDKKTFLEQLYQKKPLVKIITFCLMPNHSHLLLKQTADNGISLFMSKWQNSYARYFNTKYKKKGYFFESAFKAILIETEELFWHVSRYIHLNPSSSSLVPIRKLENYPWSSLPDYLEKRTPLFTKTDLVLYHFKGRKAYRQFVFNQAAYQKKLQKIKHLIME